LHPVTARANTRKINRMSAFDMLTG
jgi:hypothetical protein